MSAPVTAVLGLGLMATLVLVPTLFITAASWIDGHMQTTAFRRRAGRALTGLVSRAAAACGALPGYVGC